GQTLPADECVAIADQFHGGAHGITPVEQPAKIAHGSLQRRPCARPKEAFILGTGATMRLFVRGAVHGATWDFAPTRTQSRSGKPSNHGGDAASKIGKISAVARIELLASVAMTLHRPGHGLPE